jgi:uncharacterized protein
VKVGRVAIAWLLLACACIAAAADVPYLTGRVVDEASILSPAAREDIASLSKAHEERTTNQIAVLTVPTIGDESVEDYAVRVFEAWKLGRSGQDNGVLVVVVPNDRRMRIEVGYGLEGTLTDAAASRIVRNVMTPAFKQGRYDDGLRGGVDAIVATLEGHAPAAATEAPRSEPGAFELQHTVSWPMRVLIGAFVFSIIGLFTFIGIVTPGVGWFLYAFLVPFWAMFPLIVVGPRVTLGILGAYLVGYPLAKLVLRRTRWYEKAARELKTKGRASIGGFAITGAGGGSGSSRSSSSSSSGGFSGGGGSSGGGGASGSW